MGEVCPAEDTSLEREVAVKFLPEGIDADPLAQRKFLRETKSAAAIEQPSLKQHLKEKPPEVDKIFERCNAGRDGQQKRRFAMTNPGVLSAFVLPLLLVVSLNFAQQPNPAGSLEVIDATGKKVGTVMGMRQLWRGRRMPG